MIETSTTANGQILSAKNNLSELYSTYKNQPSSPTISRSPSLSSIHSSSSSSSSSSSCLSNKANTNLALNKIDSSSSISSNQRKESISKLPYPVLSDHRDPSSVLVLLQKETHATSKKISNVIKQIEDYEQRLTLNIYAENEKKTFKYERAKLKQQLDALKKHERRVSLQIDFITTKTEIKGLEDEQKQNKNNQNSDEIQQFKILLGKLKQKLDKMKIYMRTRNEQMKKNCNSKEHVTNSNNNRKPSLSSSQKQHLYSSSAKDLDRKRPSTSVNNHPSNKRLKPTVPVVRLASRVTSHDSKNHSKPPPPLVRFINKTSNSTSTTTNSTSPTTPASSSSTLSPPVIASRSRGDTNSTEISLEHNEIPSVDDDDDLDLELDMDELFDYDLRSQQTLERLKAEKNISIRQKRKMTLTFKCYQNDFLIKNLNIASFGDCFGSIIACMAFALLIELNRGIDLYLRNYPVTHQSGDSRRPNTLSEKTIQRRRFMLHMLRTLVHLAQTGLSYILMLMVMNNFAGFFLSAIIALGIGYYLLNGVHPYTRSANHTHMSTASDLTNTTDITNEDNEPSVASDTTPTHQRIMSINN
ncbi:unnamed protein product [Rotaria magnacalcarata]|uniref:Copper transporter n=1 Tax=Rotaria magnacalcarata TaxID=392030 RepID=A0A819LCK8_9BILA|nr:unnamed protein product [Rotaria magnacalcarata]